MKHIALFLITIYQQYISILLCHITGVKNHCRYEVSCSQYAKEVIIKKGVIIGGYRAIVRILSCQPYFKVERYGKSL